MKYFLALIILILAGGLQIQAQDLYSIEKSTVTAEEGQRASILMEFPEIPIDEIKEVWNNFVEDQKDVKVKGLGFLANKDVLETDFEMIPKLSKNKTKLIAKFDEYKNGSNVHVYGKTNELFYITDTSQVYDNLFNVCKEFLEVKLPTYYQERLEDQTDKLEDLEKNEDKLNKDIRKAEEDIEKAKKDIQELEQEIENHKKEIEEVKNEREDLTDEMDKTQRKIKNLKNKLKS